MLAPDSSTGNYTWKLTPNATSTVIFKVNGGTAPYTFAVSSGTPPVGMSLDAVRGTVSGTPTVAGFFPFSVQVTDSKSLSSVTPVSFTIAGTGPVVLTQTLPVAQSGFPYDSGLVATGGHPGAAPFPYVWRISSGTLPPGIAFSNGFFTGTPFIMGSYSFVVTVSDYTGASFVQPLTLTVASLEITTTSLPGILEGSPYNQTLMSQYGAPPLFWSLASGTLPKGITLSGAGVLSGTPESSGAFVFTVKLTDGADHTAQQQLTLNVTPLLPLVITSQSVPDAVQGQAYSASLTVSGGAPPYQWSLFSGALPAESASTHRPGRSAEHPRNLGSSQCSFKCRTPTGLPRRFPSHSPSIFRSHLSLPWLMARVSPRADLPRRARS